jgi:hypothetical protein
MPRGRPDPLGQVFNRGRVHLVARPEVLEKDRTKLDQAQSRLASGDDGVHAGTVAVVGAHATISITVECGGVAAGPTVPFAGDQVDKRFFLNLLHKSLSLRCWGGRGRG